MPSKKPEDNGHSNVLENRLSTLEATNPADLKERLSALEAAKPAEVRDDVVGLKRDMKWIKWIVGISVVLLSTAANILLRLIWLVGT